MFLHNVRATRYLLLVLLLALTDVAQAGSFVYVSVAGENRIAVYERNPISGALMHRSDTMVSGGPGALAVDPAHRYLFASIRSQGRIASFRMDAATGKLTLLSEVDAGADPAFLACEQSGRYLIAAYYRAGKVTVHEILGDGRLEPNPVTSVVTDEKAHAVAIDRANRHVFVPHTGPNAIFQFRFNDATGSLASNGIVRRPEATGPRHLWFHPSKDLAYVSDEQGSSLSVYRYDGEKGALQPIQTITTLPFDFKQRNSTADIEVHPSGRFVMVANRGHDSLAVFSLDPVTGLATSLAQTPTEATPRSFNISPFGRHVYVAGQSSGNIVAYACDAESGVLTRLATYPVGDGPWWVQVVNLR